MAKLTDAELKWLERLAQAGTWPDRPFLRDVKTSASLMRRGLVELIEPSSRNLAVAAITPAGRSAIQEREETR